MLHPNAKKMLENLATNIRSGTLTPAECITDATYVCYTEQIGEGLNYLQSKFDNMPPTIQGLMRGHAKGDRIGACKIVGVYHIWDAEKKPEVKTEPALAKVVLNN